MNMQQDYQVIIIELKIKHKTMTGLLIVLGICAAAYAIIGVSTDIMNSKK